MCLYVEDAFIDVLLWNTTYPVNKLSWNTTYPVKKMPLNDLDLMKKKQSGLFMSSVTFSIPIDASLGGKQDDTPIFPVYLSSN